ncbi:nuclease-related domain-containing protein [Kribbella sp. VKM Ac-2566]|uniref:nuclease-related domain-containing protein n=1 Tax=Kribbella sp. VKM Ac-2566 TaxID=2512218 RepID=UPI0014170707|nr:nuclease-related domain-containing protein [Kribbella sp. VKM Ac-2566]
MTRKRRHRRLRRRRSYPRRRLRLQLTRFLRTNWWPILAFAGMCATATVPVTLVVHGYLLGVAHGAVAMFFVAAVRHLFLVYTGSTRELSGAYGEDNTRDVLRRARRKRHVWNSIDNLEIQSGDVDHLVIAPAGIYAIDSKWHAMNLTDAVLDRDAATACAAARRANLILRSIHLQALEAQPIVVVWGRGQRDLPEAGCVVGGVLILRGSDLRSWLSQRPAGAISQEHATEVVTKLRLFKARVDPTRPPRAN